MKLRKCCIKSCNNIFLIIGKELHRITIFVGVYSCIVQNSIGVRVDHIDKAIIVQNKDPIVIRMQGYTCYNISQCYGMQQLISLHGPDLGSHIIGSCHKFGVIIVDVDRQNLIRVSRIVVPLLQLYHIRSDMHTANKQG